MNPKVKTALAVVVPIALAALKLAAPTHWPAYVATASTVLLAAIAVANVFHVSASYVDLLSTLVGVIDRSQAPEVQKNPAMMARARRIIGAAVLLLGLGSAVAGGATLTACNATSAQVQTTIADGAKVGACILANALSGNIDPANIIAQCAGATEQLIVDVIDDFEAKEADAGLPPVAADANRKWLNTAKQNAVAALARKAAGK